VLRIHQNCNRRIGHFARTVPRSLGRGEGYGDTFVTFLERADNATLLDVAAEISGLPAASLPRNTRSETSLPIRFRGMEGTGLGCLGGCGPCLSGRFGSGLCYPFLCSATCSRARGFPRRSSNGADHVWTVSDCYDHNGVPQAWYTILRRQRQRAHVVV
jgi:hypothetical protein